MLERALRAEYPNAEVKREPQSRAGLSQWVERILSHLRGELPSLDLPVDLQATAFQWRVWRELCRIPYGLTRSYSDVARAIGRPRAVRAVARAVATNPVAVVIPCHRVLHRDGSLSGYRWGPERKQKLLEIERRARG
jgi:AraC family transcriptional regulator of adaptative response/methylated-DNA-[protein]-cysteine methyltransferase